ncbi:MAG: type I-B CRISPR-associated protein Cas7/Cst2/DevR [Leptospiraceae bacterium]|nr:type I-B CRISPR-associated protein Cas7/Cst2/DevR [Leptospiraceae bacterium]
MSTQNKNLFCTVLTYPAPSSNYRGESEENRTVLQKISKNGKDHAIFSSESIRNALREILKTKLPKEEIDRERKDNLLDEDGKSQLSVKFYDYPNSQKYADDFIFGYMMAKKEFIQKAIEKHGKDWEAKADSVLRINYAVALNPYKYEASFHQSPRLVDSPWQNQDKSSSVLLHKEITNSAFQYPFALRGNDCKKNSNTIRWIKALLDSIIELNNVAGGHARNYFEFAPRSIIARITPKLVSGYDSYGFKEDGSWSELSRINENDLPGDEFYLGGEIVRNMKPEDKEKLNSENLFDNPERMMERLKAEFLD